MVHRGITSCNVGTSRAIRRRGLFPGDRLGAIGRCEEDQPGGFCTTSLGRESRVGSHPLVGADPRTWMCEWVHAPPPWPGPNRHWPARSPSCRLFLLGLLSPAPPPPRGLASSLPLSDPCGSEGP